MIRLAPTFRFLFGTEALNIRISDRDPLTNERVDKNLDRYGHLFRAFVLKRRINRGEIWPKMHIIDEAGGEEEAHVGCQSLFAMKKSMRDEVMSAISKNDPSQINSAFIISTFCEDHFKEMMDQYLAKLLVCGKAPADPEAYCRLEERVMELYRAFYFGERGTALEREIEQAYLNAKQFKHIRGQTQRQANPNLFEGCVWSQKDQRLLEEKSNWAPADSNLTDINYRSYFEPLLYHQRGQQRLKYEKLAANWTWLDQVRFEWFTRKYYEETSRKYFEWVEQKLVVRIMNHLKSPEFTAALNVPHDYMIEAQLVQIHFWLLIDRLKKIATTPATVLARRLALTLSLETVRSARSVNLKKSNVLQASLERMLETNGVILQLHFNRSEVTRHNPYLGIDSLVWSVAFAEKVHRYSDEVYLFSEYLVRNVEHLQRHSYHDIANGLLEFDPFLVDPRYRQAIETLNPPLPAAQFERQFNSNSDRKDYYYSKVQREMEEAMPLEKQYQPSPVNTSFSFAQLLQPLRNLRVKYLTLKTMDHYDKMEERRKQNEEAERRGTWRSQKDELEGIHSSFASFHQLRNQRKSKNASEPTSKP